MCASQGKKDEATLSELSRQAVEGKTFRDCEDKNMAIMTFGTRLYQIPLPLGYYLDIGYPLQIEVHLGDEKVLLYCPSFDETGEGNSLDDALADLGSSIFDFWRSLHRRDPVSLSEQLTKVLEEMDNHIRKGYNSQGRGKQ